MNANIELLMDYVGQQAYMDEESRGVIQDYCYDSPLKSPTIPTLVVDCANYVKESTLDYNEKRLALVALDDFMIEHRLDVCTETMSSIYNEDACAVDQCLTDLKDTGVITPDACSNAQRILQNELYHQAFNSFRDSEWQINETFLSVMKDLEVLSMQDITPIIENEVEQAMADYASHLPTAYELCRKKYKECPCKAEDGLPISDLAVLYQNTDVEPYVTALQIAKESALKESVDPMFDVKPLPYTYHMESTIIDTIDNTMLQTFLKDFSEMPIYKISGTKYLEKECEERTAIKNALLHYKKISKKNVEAFDNLKHDSDVTIFTMPPEGSKDKEKAKKEAEKRKADKDKILTMNAGDKSAKVVVSKFYMGKDPFLASILIGDTKKDFQIWMVYKDPMVKEHLLYYTAKVLFEKSLYNPMVLKWANTFNKQEKPLVAKEATEETISPNEKEPVEIDFDKYKEKYKKPETIEEVVSVGTMLPQVPLTGSLVTKEDMIPVPMEHPITQQDTDNYPYAMDPITKVVDNTAETVIKAGMDKDASDVTDEAIALRENIESGVEMPENDLDDAKVALDKVDKVLESVLNKYEDSPMPTKVTEDGMNRIMYLLEQVVPCNTIGFSMLFEATVNKAMDLYRPQTSLSIFKDYNEAAKIDDDMKGIIDLLHKKGYQTKYSCSGHRRSPKKEDRNKDNIYYGKLYTTGNLVFARTYKFPNLPDMWYINQTARENGRTAIYVKPLTFDDKGGKKTGTDGFDQWKKKYMANLKAWVLALPDAPALKESDKVVAKMDKYTDQKIKKERLDKLNATKTSFEMVEESVKRIFQGGNPYDI